MTAWILVSVRLQLASFTNQSFMMQTFDCCFFFFFVAVLYRNDLAQSSQPWHQWIWGTRWPEWRNHTFLKIKDSTELWQVAWPSLSWWGSTGLIQVFLSGADKSFQERQFKSENVSPECNVTALNLLVAHKLVNQIVVDDIWSRLF